MENIIWPNKDTKIFISMALNPGNTGAKLHNHLFRMLELNCVYLPLKVENLSKAKHILKCFNYHGCSLSMPFKEKLIGQVDRLDIKAKKIGSINTILKKKNKLYGYNTDYFASKSLLKNYKKLKNNRVLVLGCGGVAKAILQSLNDLSFEKVYVSTRNKKRFTAAKLNKKFVFLPWKLRDQITVDIIINTTPLGMFGKWADKTPIKIKKNKPKLIYDLPVNYKGNKLFKYAKKNKINYISGIKSSLIQGVKQFEIYNNIKVGKKILKKLI